MNGGVALAPRPSRVDRRNRLVVVGETSDVPAWVRRWCRRTGRQLQLHPVPQTVPGHRPDPVHLLAEVTALAGDAVLVVSPGADQARPADVTAALHDLPDDFPVLAAAADTARHLDCAVVLTHGLPLSFAERSVGLRPALDHARLLLGEAAHRLADDAPDVHTVTRLVRAHPHELVGEDLDTGLLVVGGPRRHVPDELGLVVRSALQHATCPMLVVPR